MNTHRRLPAEQAGRAPSAQHGTGPVGVTPTLPSEERSCPQVRQPGRGWGLGRELRTGQWQGGVGARARCPGSGEGRQLAEEPLREVGAGRGGHHAACLGPSKCDIDETRSWKASRKVVFTRKLCRTDLLLCTGRILITTF